MSPVKIHWKWSWWSGSEWEKEDYDGLFPLSVDNLLRHSLVLPRCFALLGIWEWLQGLKHLESGLQDVIIGAVVFFIFPQKDDSTEGMKRINLNSWISECKSLSFLLGTCLKLLDPMDVLPKTHWMKVPSCICFLNQGINKCVYY